MVARTKGPEHESAGEWLEGELRETKARLHKVEGELEQALKHVWSLDADIQKLAEALTVSGSAANQLSALREQVRQVHDQLGRIQDRQSAITNRTEEVLRQRQADSSRERHDLTVLAKQLEAVAKGIDQRDGRLQALEEAFRHVEDEVAGSRLAGQGLERGVEEVAGRADRSLEATVRLEQEVAHAKGEIDARRKADETLDDRMRLMLEQVRRLSERIDKLDGIADFPQEARELLHRGTAERDQLTQRLALLDKLAGEVSERVKECVQTVARLDQRAQTQAAQLMDLSGQLNELADQTRGQIKRAFQLLLRQRRRQSETLAQEIKELSQGELHGGD